MKTPLSIYTRTLRNRAVELVLSLLDTSPPALLLIRFILDEKKERENL